MWSTSWQRGRQKYGIAFLGIHLHPVIAYTLAIIVSVLVIVVVSLFCLFVLEESIYGDGRSPSAVPTDHRVFRRQGLPCDSFRRE